MLDVLEPILLFLN